MAVLCKIAGKFHHVILYFKAGQRFVVFVLCSVQARDETSNSSNFPIQFCKFINNHLILTLCDEMQARFAFPIKQLIVLPLITLRGEQLWWTPCCVTIQDVIIKVIIQWVIRDGTPRSFNPIFLFISFIVVSAFWKMRPVRIDHLIQNSNHSFLQKIIYSL